MIYTIFTELYLSKALQICIRTQNEHSRNVSKISLIPWLFINQSEHTINVEYLSYLMVTIISLLVKEFKIYA